jgi:hypothetical protein
MNFGSTMNFGGLKGPSVRSGTGMRRDKVVLTTDIETMRQAR